MTRIIDNITENQRLAILDEILQDLKQGEKDLIAERLKVNVQADEESEEYQRELGRLVAARRNNSSLVSGVQGKKLI